MYSQAESSGKPPSTYSHDDVVTRQSALAAIRSACAARQPAEAEGLLVPATMTGSGWASDIDPWQSRMLKHGETENQALRAEVAALRAELQMRNNGVPPREALNKFVDTPHLRRLVNEYRDGCEMVHGHAIPQWRRLVAYVVELCASGSSVRVVPSPATAELLAMQNIERPHAVAEIKRRLEGMIGNRDNYEQGYRWVLEMVEIVEEAFKAVSPVQVVVERERIWIRKGVQSFPLDYQWDSPEELEWYLARLQGVLSSITHGVKFDPSNRITSNPSRMPSLPKPDVRQSAAPVPQPTAYSEELVIEIQRTAFEAGLSGQGI